MNDDSPWGRLKFRSEQYNAQVLFKRDDDSRTPADQAWAK